MNSSSLSLSLFECEFLPVNISSEFMDLPSCSSSDNPSTALLLPSPFLSSSSSDAEPLALSSLASTTRGRFAVDAVFNISVGPSSSSELLSVVGTGRFFEGFLCFRRAGCGSSLVTQVAALEAALGARHRLLSSGLLVAFCVALRARCPAFGSLAGGAEDMVNLKWTHRLRRSNYIVRFISNYLYYY